MIQDSCVSYKLAISWRTQGTRSERTLKGSWSRDILNFVRKMAGGVQPRRNDIPAIKYRYNPHDGTFFDLGDFIPKEYAPRFSDDRKQNGKIPEGRPSAIVSTGELISAAGQVWDITTRLFADLHPKTTSIDNEELHEGNMFYYPSEDGKIRTSTSTKSKNLSSNSNTSSNFCQMMPVNFDCLNVTQKRTLFQPCCESHMHSLLWRYQHSSSNIHLVDCEAKRLSSIPISYDLRNIYRWMNDTGVVEHQLINKKKINEFSAGETSNHASCCLSVHTSFSANELMTGNDKCHTEIINQLETSPQKRVKDILRKNRVNTPQCLDCFHKPVQDVNANGGASVTPRPILQPGFCKNALASGTSSYKESQHKVEEDLYESDNDQGQYIIDENSEVDTGSSAQNKPQYSLAKQEHAYAGAFAGIFVSLCLHPVDTVKTVVQSCRTNQNSIHYISKSIISERGVSGLYRGIASNIASSAPISAVYTFTYESIKGILLPLFAKDFHSLAHCTAGGCASIATSFIFTPSERVKQQMQVGSHYQNCWTALLGIVGKGGFSSLYAGWGAVLCRNVPHSIIKFYTYESLKQFMLSSSQSNVQPTTVSTLVCGGFAGSTAALFTTPFDVVKTRLQTQIPGSASRYDGVFNTLKVIAKHEGLKGLYRGLTPRLAMYMTQGALFFASYESFKRVFSLEAPQLIPQRIQHEPKREDNFTSSSKVS